MATNTSMHFIGFIRLGIESIKAPAQVIEEAPWQHAPGSVHKVLVTPSGDWSNISIGWAGHWIHSCLHID